VNRTVKGSVCSTCQGRDWIIDPISGDCEPYACPDCGGSGLWADSLSALGERINKHGISR
jgi:hypothetical protein